VGFDDEEIDALLAEMEDDPGELEDPGAQEPPENPVTRPGDLWLLGSHRLLCGDSTQKDDVARLMNGDTAALLATDPPYLVDYDGTNHPAEHHEKAGRTAPEKKGSTVGNKHWDTYIDPASSVEFFRRFLELGLQHCRNDVAIYQWHATRRQALVEEAWTALDLLVHQTIIWAKTRGVLTRSHFLWAHEPAFYGWRRGSMPAKERRPPPSETTVWDIGQAGEEHGLHPTMKPRDIFRRPIEWHTRKGEVVYEPFSGSGTQIVAAEELGRRCFAMELSPAFVDAAILRWERATGQEAVLDGRGETFAITADRRSE
jgi:DNA modification methylase